MFWCWLAEVMDAAMPPYHRAHSIVHLILRNVKTEQAIRYLQLSSMFAQAWKNRMDSR